MGVIGEHAWGGAGSRGAQVGQTVGVREEPPQLRGRVGARAYRAPRRQPLTSGDCYLLEGVKETGAQGVLPGKRWEAGGVELKERSGPHQVIKEIGSHALHRQSRLLVPREDLVHWVGNPPAFWWPLEDREERPV